MEFWIAGILFTLGLTTNNMERRKWLFGFLHIPLWPLILGMWIEEYLDKERS